MIGHTARPPADPDDGPAIERRSGVPQEGEA
jgi:hypothetical protein